MTFDINSIRAGEGSVIEPSIVGGNRESRLYRSVTTLWDDFVTTLWCECVVSVFAEQQQVELPDGMGYRE